MSRILASLLAASMAFGNFAGGIALAAPTGLARPVSGAPALPVVYHKEQYATEAVSPNKKKERIARKQTSISWCSG